MREGAGGDGGCDDDALAVLLDLGGLQKLFEGGVGLGVGKGLGERAGESNQRGQVSGLAGGFVLGGGNLLDSNAERGERAGNGERGSDTGDDGGVRLERKCEAEDVNGSALREREADLADSPGEREQRYIVIVALEKRGA